MTGGLCCRTCCLARVGMLVRVDAAGPADRIAASIRPTAHRGIVDERPPTYQAFRWRRERRSRSSTDVLSVPSGRSGFVYLRSEGLRAYAWEASACYATAQPPNSADCQVERLLSLMTSLAAARSASA